MKHTQHVLLHHCRLRNPKGGRADALHALVLARSPPLSTQTVRLNRCGGAGALACSATWQQWDCTPSAADALVDKRRRILPYSMLACSSISYNSLPDACHASASATSGVAGDVACSLAVPQCPFLSLYAAAAAAAVAATAVTGAGMWR